jgi:hypothetical protein
LTAAPAVGERLPVFRLVDDFALDMAGNIARCNGGTALFRLKRVDLLVERADIAAFFVVQRGPVHGAGQMILIKLAFTAGVDDGVKLMQTLDDLTGGQGAQAHFSSFFSSGHTLASMRGWASSLG